MAKCVWIYRGFLKQDRSETWYEEYVADNPQDIFKKLLEKKEREAWFNIDYIEIFREKSIPQEIFSEDLRKGAKGRKKGKRYVGIPLCDECITSLGDKSESVGKTVSFSFVEEKSKTKCCICGKKATVKIDSIE